jgi:hypothetical protein
MRACTGSADLAKKLSSKYLHIALFHLMVEFFTGSMREHRFAVCH